MGSEAGSIAGEIDRSWKGGGWSGPGLREILNGVDEATARWKPAADVHSIFELLLHAQAWARVTLERTLGREYSPSDEQNFPPPAGNWADALQHADALHASLVEAVRELKPEALGAKAPGCDYSVRFMLHGVAQHNLYHAGQMALLKKLFSAYDK